MTDQALSIATTVNGSPLSTRVEPRWTLAELLRDHLRLTGTKVSCEMQVCGACTVLVDGDPVSSCTYLAADVHGRAVTTIEGLAGGQELHPIQQAFVEEFALQCGYCTPGFVMMAKALLDENPSPTTEEVVHHLEGNICRCTGYAPIVAAVLRAATLVRERADGWTPTSQRPPFPIRRPGTTSLRLDALAKVTGAATYAIDMAMPGMLYGKAARAERAHARIVGIETTAALTV